MIRHYFQCLNFNPKLLRFLSNQFLQACFNIPKKNITAIFGTPHEVKMQVKNRPRCPSITRLSHDNIICRYSIIVNYITKKEEGKRGNQVSRPSTFGAQGARFLCQLKQTVPSPQYHGERKRREREFRRGAGRARAPRRGGVYTHCVENLHAVSTNSNKDELVPAVEGKHSMYRVEVLDDFPILLCQNIT